MGLILDPKKPNEKLFIDTSNYAAVEQEVGELRGGYSKLYDSFARQISQMNAWVWIFFTFGLILPGVGAFGIQSINASLV